MLVFTGTPGRTNARGISHRAHRIRHRRRHRRSDCAGGPLGLGRGPVGSSASAHLLAVRRPGSAAARATTTACRAASERIVAERAAVIIPARPGRVRLVVFDAAILVRSALIANDTVADRRFGSVGRGRRRCRVRCVRADAAPHHRTAAAPTGQRSHATARRPGLPAARTELAPRRPELR